MPVLSVRVSDAIALRFDAAAASAGGRSILLRRLVDRAAEPAPPAAAGLPTAAAGRGSGRAPAAALRLMVRLGAAEAAALAREAETMGLRPSTWAAGLLAARLRGAPCFAAGEAAALLAIEDQVRRIGVNLNQMARALNTAVLEGRVLDLQLAALEAFRGELRAHLAGVREAFAGNHAYWAGEP